MRKVFISFLALLATLVSPVARADTPSTVYILPIRGEIEPALLYVVRRGLDEAKQQEASAVVIAMDTPGGRVDVTSEILSLLEKVEVPTYTFVEKHAFSAGAMIAMGTDHIYMAPGSVIGAAMPIMMSPGSGPQELPEDVQEKQVSAVAAMMRSAAESNGHDSRLAEKMVRRDGEYKIGDEIINTEGQLLTLTNLEAERPIGEEKKPLLSLGTVKDIPAMLDKAGLGAADTVELQVTTAERIARYIASLAPILMMAGMLGIYVEIKTPGVGIPGILGALCLALFFWGHHIAGLAGSEEILIFILGFACVLLEVFALPGTAALGVGGVVLMLWALLMSMTEALPDGSWVPELGIIELPLRKLALAIVMSAGAGIVLSRYLPKTRPFRRMTLESSTSRDAGYSPSRQTPVKVGEFGKALMPLRPAGTVAFGDHRIDVVTRGDYLPAGVTVRVDEVHGNRIVVSQVATEKSTS